MAATPYVIALIAAAGQGTRLGAAVPKAYVELGGKTLLERSAEILAQVADELIVLIDPAWEDVARESLARISAPLRLVPGGGERADSVWAGLQALADAPSGSIVLIHDAARALTPPAVAERVIAAVAQGASAVIPVLPVTDTVKEVDADGIVVATPPRASLRAVQTPQGFDLAALRAANVDYFSAEERSFVATDDASLMEWHGHRVHTVEGDLRALKITTPLDLMLAQALVDKDKK